MHIPHVLLARLPCNALRSLNSFLRVAIVASGLMLCGAANAASTYFVRVDGGDASQCTGRGDAAYPGTGTAQACAWKGPHYALPASGSPRIAGGDTLIIGAGSYMIGWGAPGASGGRCYQGGPYDCYLAPVPSGPVLPPRPASSDVATTAAVSPHRSSGATTA